MGDDDYGYWGSDQPDDGGGVAEDTSWTDEFGMIWENGEVIGFDNGDGSWTAADGSIFGENDELIGWETGNGNWLGLDGVLYDSENNPIDLHGAGETPQNFDGTFEFDETTGLYFDSLTGAWFAVGADGNAVFVSDNINGPSFDEMAAAQGILNGSDLTPQRGFLDTVGNFLGKLFGGSGGGGGSFGGGGGGSSGGGSSSQQAQQRQQQAQQQLAQAQQSGASAQQIAQLRQQLALAQAAARGSGGLTLQQTILIAAGVGLGVYALTSSRRAPAPTLPQ